MGRKNQKFKHFLQGGNQVSVIALSAAKTPSNIPSLPDSDPAR
jgi:hypothetical protein